MADFSHVFRRIEVQKSLYKSSQYALKYVFHTRGVLNMAYIRKITRPNGDVKYKSEIVLKKEGLIIHRESRTFDKQKQAKDWATQREAELLRGGDYGGKEYLPIKVIIDAYSKQFPARGRTKRFDLEQLKGRAIAKIDVHKLNAKDLIKHIQLRNTECKPQTAANDLIWLKQVLVTMRSVMGYPFDTVVFDDARSILRQERLIANSEQRERTPTAQELLALSRYFKKGSPAYEIMWFSLYSARRISETTRIEWNDINHKNRTVVIRNLKNPKNPNITRVAKIPASAYKILIRQPQRSSRVFPYHPKTIGKYFTDACKALGIKDLHFHDLRHAATTDLFKRGLPIQDVQKITLHTTWASLSRYCNNDPGDVNI